MLNTFENRNAFHRRQEERHRAFEVIDAFCQAGLQDNDDGIESTARLSLDGFIKDGNNNDFINGSHLRSDRRMRYRYHKRATIGTILTVLMLCLSAVMLVFVPRQRATDESSLQDGNGDDKNYDQHCDDQYEALASMIVGWGLTPRSRLNDSGSSSRRALDWLVQDGYTTENSEDLLRTRFALACLYFSTQVIHEARGWKVERNWLSSVSVCFWHGVSCQDYSDKINDWSYIVTAVNLSSNALSNHLPDEIGLLSNGLTKLDLSSNVISGSLPPSLTLLTTLKDLYLGSNLFTSTLPKSIWRLQKLTHLFIDDCMLTGAIPSSITRLQNLRALGLYNNFLTSTIPDLSTLPGLTVLYLDSNVLTGTIPELPLSLIDLRLRDNLISGTLPYNLGHLLLLKICYLDTLNLTSSIPTSMGNLRLLDELHLFNSGLQGTIPSELFNLSLLRSLYLDSNEIVGTIPTLFGVTMTHLEQLYLSENFITGGIPENFHTMSHLTRLHLHSNEIEGTVPQELCPLTTSGILWELTADCGGSSPKVTCSCCSKCF